MSAIVDKILKNEIVKSVAALFGANVLGSVIGVLGSLVQGTMVTADELGFFKQFGIVSGYLFFLHLGIFHAIERLYPLYKGAGEDEKAVEVVETGAAWMLFVCVSISLVFGICCCSAFCRGDWKSGTCWVVQIAAIWSTLYGGFLSATYRSGREFQKMAKANVYSQILSLVAIPFYWLEAFFTMAFRSSVSVVSTFFLYLSRPVKVRLNFNLKLWASMLKQGLPLFSASYVTSTGLDAFRGTLILLFLTHKDLGYWSFAYMCFLILFQLPSSITAVYLPRVIAEYAKSKDVSSCVNIIKKPVKYGFIVLCLLVPIGFSAVHFLLQTLLPNYIGAESVADVLLMSLPLKLSDGIATILTALNKLKTLNVVAFLATFIQVLTSITGAVCGFGIVSFAWGFFAGYLTRSILLLILVNLYVRKDNNISV